MSGLYKTKKNNFRILAAKKRAIEYTDKFEKLLSLTIVILATIGILKTVLQAIS